MNLKDIAYGHIIYDFLFGDLTYEEAIVAIKELAGDRARYILLDFHEKLGIPCCPDKVDGWCECLICRSYIVKKGCGY